MAFDKKAFDRFVIEKGVIGFPEKPVTFVGGRVSPVYLSWRGTTSDTWSVAQIAEFVIAFAEDLGLRPECFYGVPEGATRLGLVTQYLFASRQPDFKTGKYLLAMGRGKPKEHGDPKDRDFVLAPKGPTIILEDTTTTGMSLLQAVQKVRDAGAPIIAVITLINRGERRDDGKTVAEALAAEGIPCHSLTTLPELLPRALGADGVSEATRGAVRAYFERYGE